MADGKEQRIYSVLVAEDEPSLMRLMELSLTMLERVERYKLIVYKATNGLSALKVLSEHPKSGATGSKGGIDLVISDINMPGKTGLDVVVEGRIISPATQFVLWSGNAGQYMEKAKELGVPIMQKSDIGGSQLVGALKGYLNSK